MSLNKKLNESYLKLHINKEESFWESYMNLSSSVVGKFEKNESILKEFSSNSSVLLEIRDELEKNDLSQWERTGLMGWKHFFECNAIENKEALKISKKIIDMEGELRRKRRSYSLGYKDPESGDFVESGIGKLLLIIANDKHEHMRKAAWTGLRDLELFVLNNGYIELVKERNKLGKLLGYEDFYDYKTYLNEGMSKKQLFTILDSLKDNTADVCFETFDQINKTHGDGSASPWNIRYHTEGDLSEKLEPYFPFDLALSRWGRTFHDMGVDLRESTVHIDLVARKGKYENAFMHGPFPPYNEDGKFYPARLNFTANAVPGQIGGGRRAINTLMHEGGHAAHFSNINQPSPCFSQEFAPTSGAFAETQSMLMDSLLSDADWLWKYGEDKEGNKMPDRLIRELVETENRYLSFSLRYLTVVPYAEKSIYELSDKDLTAENILKAIRLVEGEFFGFDCPRPTLAVPHLLSGEAAATYHAYVLAYMGVYQTKAHLKEKFHSIVNNKEIGKELCKKYWNLGNSKTFAQFIKDMTGKDFSAQSTIDVVNKKLPMHVKEAMEAVEFQKSKDENKSPVNLNCSIRMVHGDQLICDSQKGFENMSKEYSQWYKTL